MKIINLTDKLEWLGHLTPLDLTQVQHIVLHHIYATTATPEEIHQWHLEQGNDPDSPMYRCIGFGYNEYIRKDGTVYIGRGDNQGAQCYGLNQITYGIACEGNYEVEQTMPQAQLDSLIARIQFNKKRFGKFESVEPHYRFSETSCPGKYFPMEKINLTQIMPMVQFGDTGDSVSYLQKELNNKGFDCGNVDGIFGMKTQRGVLQFQKANGLVQDGIAGPKTWGKLLGG